VPDLTVRPSVQHLQAAPDDERASVELVCACVESFENGIGRSFRDNCIKRYKQYRSFSRWRDAWVRSGPNDKDALLYDAKDTWGAQLHIPLSFRTIEAMVPRAIAHRPRMLYLPTDPRWEDGVEAVQMLIDRQQENIDIDLAFQTVMRSGRIYGLGVSKTFWRTEYAPQRRSQRRTIRLPGQNDYIQGPLKYAKVFDDPDFEDVDVFDFMWDPFGSEVNRRTNRVGWITHRLWFSLETVMDRIRSGAWNTASAQALTEDDVRGMGGRSKYDEVWSDRMEASGFTNARDFARGEQIHEVWEYHDGERVLTVLDRRVLVQDAENPCLGQFPFQVYRPTPLQYEMVGIGDLEPLEHLQRELDTTRSQIRDAATLALAPAIFFDDGAIEEDEIVLGPHGATRVSNARPSDAVYFAPKPDLPASAFEVEQSIRADIDAVSGFSDQITNDQGGGPIGTATEAQLAQASLSRRIELSSHRFEVEIVRHSARGFLVMDQRMILESRTLRQPGEGLTPEQAYEQGRWRWVQVGPGELQGEWEIIPEGGSMAAKNVVQDRADGMQAMQIFGQNPFIDPQQVLLYSLKKFGVQNPKSWLKQQAPPVPPEAVAALKRSLPERAQLIDFIVARAQRADPQLPQDPGPNVPMVDAAMNGNGGGNGG
jgi:hypothetical protein